MRNGAFIFDLDGTLFDSELQIAKALRKTRLSRGFPDLAVTRLFSLIGLPARELVRDLNLSNVEEIELVKDFREELALEITRHNPMYSGAYEFVRMVSGFGFRIGIATSKPSSLARLVIQNSEISSFVSYIQGTDQFPPKPDPSVITSCLEGIRVKSGLMFGDRTEDILAARAAGVVGIGICQTSHSHEDLYAAGANHVFSSFLEAAEEIEHLVEMAQNSI